MCDIHNTTFDLQGDSKEWRLNFGVAVCDFASPTIYIDYGSDGLVDVKLLARIGDIMIGVGAEFLSGGASMGLLTARSIVQGGASSAKNPETRS